MNPFFLVGLAGLVGTGAATEASIEESSAAKVIEVQTTQAVKSKAFDLSEADLIKLGAAEQKRYSRCLRNKKLQENLLKAKS